MFKKIFLPLILMLGMTSCSIAPNTTADNVFITDTHAAAVVFRSLRVEEQNSLIKGQIHRLGRDPIHFGQVDYAVLDTSGKVRESGSVEHSAAIRLRSVRRPSLFNITLKQPLQAGEKVKLSYTIR